MESQHDPGEKHPATFPNMNDLIELQDTGPEGSETAPTEIKLLAGETLLSIEPVVMPPRPDARPSSPAAFLRLFPGAETQDQIGNQSPLAAAPKPELTGEAFNRYAAKYVRDGLTVAEAVKAIYERVRRTSVVEYAQDMGVTDDPLSEEEPGRLPHEIRDPQSAIAQELTAKRNWGWPYYGSVDATLMWINATTECAAEDLDFLNSEYTGRDEETHSLRYALDQAVAWVERKTASNSEGLVEFKSSNDGGGIEKGGIENQVWKDSPDAYHHKDGSIANHEQGIASVEVQAMAYDALLNSADLYEQKLSEIGDDHERVHMETKIADLRTRAAKIKSTVMEQFWVEDENGGFFALGTDRDDDGNLRALAVRTSNMGLLLNSRLLEDDDPETARRVRSTIDTLFSENMLSEYGIRTLGKDEVRYRPGAYHNGSVWPKDTHEIAVGLARHGYFALARELNRRTERIFDETHQYPELIRGDADGSPEKPVITDRIVRIQDDNLHWVNRVEEPPQPDQAWTIAAAVAIEYENQNWPAAADDLAKLRAEKEVLEKVARLNRAA